ncbi:transposable element Tcb2 transposase [Trichonephila clavipes]|nr:transposable element Tcb2 transposase [Trichonephila clavipes]
MVKYRRVALQVDRSDLTVRTCWDHGTKETSFTRRPGSERPRQTNRREDHHIIRHARFEPPASLAAVLTQAAPSLRVPVSSRTIAWHLTKGNMVSRRPLRRLPMTPTHRRIHLEWCRAPRDWIATEWNQVVFSDESRFNLSKDDNRVRVWRPCGKRLNPVFALQLHTASKAGVMAWDVIV